MQALFLIGVYILTTFSVQFIGFLISRLVDFEFQNSRPDDVPGAVHCSLRDRLADRRAHRRMGHPPCRLRGPTGGSARDLGFG